MRSNGTSWIEDDKKLVDDLAEKDQTPALCWCWGRGTQQGQPLITAT